MNVSYCDGCELRFFVPIVYATFMIDVIYYLFRDYVLTHYKTMLFIHLC